MKKTLPFRKKSPRKKTSSISRLILSLLMVAVLVLGISNIYLWKDNTFQWRIIDTQIKMLNRLLQLQDNNRVYEDESIESTDNHLNNTDI